MQIQSISNFQTNQNKSFGAKQLDTVKVLKKVENDKFVPIKAIFSELEINNEKDIDLVKGLQEKWQHFTAFGQSIFSDFLSKIKTSRFFMLEAIDENDKKVTNVMETTTTKRPFKTTREIMYLQSSPEIADKMEVSPIKGSGEIAMYEIVKLSKDEKVSSINLISVANDFYKKIGMNDISNNSFLSKFGLDKKDYSAFLERIKQKYNLT
jgi:hypothetical protein